jgi:hypothetical protein
MAHYAFLDAENIVTEVIVGRDEGDPVDWEAHYGAFRGQVCKRTSYNTVGGVHYTDGVPSEDQSKAYRKNYAGIGYSYDPGRDAFISPKPYPSWILNEDTCLWDPPIPYPEDGKLYAWNEETQSWDLVEPEEEA